MFLISGVSIRLGLPRECLSLGIGREGSSGAMGAAALPPYTGWAMSHVL